MLEEWLQLMALDINQLLEMHLEIGVVSWMCLSAVLVIWEKLFYGHLVPLFFVCSRSEFSVNFSSWEQTRLYPEVVMRAWYLEAGLRE